MQEKYSGLLSQILDENEGKRADHLKNLREARDNLQSSRNTRSKRSATPSYPHLSQEQRTSLEKFYKLNNSLKNASKELSLELRSKVEGLDIPVSLPHFNGNNNKNIEKSLKTIGWTEESIKTQKNRGSSQFFNPKSWGNWNGNPFKPFYKNEQEFTKDIQHLQKNAFNAYKQQQELVRNQGRALQRFRFSSIHPTLQSQYEAIQKRISELQASQDSHIVSKVASYLLRSMGQDN